MADFLDDVAAATCIPLRYLVGGLDLSPATENYLNRMRRAHYLLNWRSSPFFRYGMRIPGTGIRAKKMFPSGYNTRRRAARRKF